MSSDPILSCCLIVSKSDPVLSVLYPVLYFTVLPYPILSWLLICHVLSYPVLPCLVPFVSYYLFLSCPILSSSYYVVSHSVVSYPILSYCILSFILTYPVLPCPIVPVRLSCPVIPCPVLFLSYMVMWQDGDSSVVRAPDSWLKGRGFESLLERRENFLLQGRLSVLTLISVSVPPPCYHSST